MGNVICKGKVVTVRPNYVAIDQEVDETGPNGEVLYETFTFEKWQFWRGVKIDDWARVSVNYLPFRAQMIIERIEEPAAEEVA